MAKAKKTVTKKATPPVKKQPAKKPAAKKKLPPSQTSIPAVEAVSEGSTDGFNDLAIKEIMIQKGMTREEAIAHLSDPK